MRPSVIGVIVLVVMTALIEQAWAQPPASPGESQKLTLQEAIRTALEKHPVLQSAEFAVRGAEARAKQAESPYYPQVGGVAAQTNGALRANSVLRPAGALIQPNQSDMTVGVVASQTVYDFGQTASRLDAQRSDKIRVEKDAMTRRAEVVLGVERAYFNVLKRKRLVEIAEHTVRERDVLKQQVETLYRNQLKSKLDLGLVQVQLSDAEFLVIRARNDLAAAFADLNNAMGVEGPVTYTLEEIPVKVEPPRVLDDLMGEAMDRRPELLAGRKHTELSRPPSGRWCGGHGTPFQPSEPSGRRLVGRRWCGFGAALHRLSDPEPSGGGYRPTTRDPGRLSHCDSERPVGGEGQLSRCGHADPAN